jgi:carboxylesterase
MLGSTTFYIERRYIMLKFIKKFLRKKFRKKRVGLFAVHGFMENGMMSFRNLSVVLDSMKKEYRLTDLQGHRENENINEFNHEKCLREVEAEYVEFKMKYDEVMLIGFSMGGAIAAHLASKYGATKLVLVSAALKYGGTKRITSQALNMVKKAFGKTEDRSAAQFLMETINMSKEEIGKLANDLLEDYQKNRYDKERATKNLSEAKIGVFMNFMKLISVIRDNLGWLDMPTRIYQSTDDELIPIESGYDALEKCTSLDRKLIILNKTRHGILNSELKAYVIKDIIDFFYEENK